jgi:NAD(P)H-dependent FMN reductase
MSVLALSGSRNRQGSTAHALDALATGVRNRGGDWEDIFLTEKKIERCRQCGADGWGICISEERCVIKDDFPSIVDRLKNAQLVVFATPVYFHDLSESMKAFLDRLHRIGFAKIMRQSSPPIPGMNGEGTPAIGLCYAGGSGNGTTSCCFTLERTLQTCGFDVVDMIPVRRQNLEMKLPLLEKVGEWLATIPVSGPFMPPPR